MATQQNRLIDNEPQLLATTLTATESTVLETDNLIDTTKQSTEMEPIPPPRRITQWGSNNSAAAATPDTKLHELHKSVPAP